MSFDNNAGLPAPSQIMPDVYPYSNPQVGQGAAADYTGYKDYRTVDPHSFMEHTFYGSKHYRDCGYLQYTDRELQYQTRRKISCYTNVFRPIINAMVDPVFDGRIVRETSNDLFQQFIDNCDATGTSLSNFMNIVLLHARLYSLTFIVMENFRAEKVKQAQNVKEQIEQRNFPYIYEKTPQQVKAHTTNHQGKLTSIVFCDEKITMGEGKEKKDVQTYRYWDAQDWKVFYYDKDENKVTIEEGAHGLGVIPVIPVLNFSKTANLKTFPDPHFYNMAVLCLHLFNKESQVAWLEIMQTFAILVTSGLGAQARAIGPATALDLPVDSKWQPNYITPSQEGIRTLVSNCDRVLASIKDQAKQTGVIGVVESKSGIAKEWDFRAEESVLKETAEAGEDVEEKLAGVFGLYTGSPIEYEVEYPHSFNPTADLDKINTRLTVLKEYPPEAVKKEIWLDIARALWPDDAEMLEKIEAMLGDDEKRNAAIAAMRENELTMTNQTEAMNE
jgi:hypothetical protein